MPDLEGHGSAWHRCYEIRGAGKGWMQEGVCPIRLRGYSELIMSRIIPKVRKKIDTALKRGYRLDAKKDHVTLLNMICKHNPIQPVMVGYVGKSRFNVWVPNLEDAKDLRQELDAQTVMTEAFKGANICVNAGKSISGYHEVYFRAQEFAGGKGSKNQPQLKARFTEIRFAIDEWMEKDAAVREQVAKWVARDDSVIRIPFDTHKEEANES